MVLLSLPERCISSFRVIGHLHKERAAVLFGTEKTLHGHQQMRKTQVVPKCRVGGMPAKLVKQRNKPKVLLAKSCGDFHDSLLMHTGVQMKYISKLTDARRASRGRNLTYSII